MADEAAKRSLIDHFSALEDPRQAAKVVYPLPEIMLVVLCATIAAAEDFVEVRRWGCEKLAFLRTLLPFARGIPSHDTLSWMGLPTAISSGSRRERLGLGASRAGGAARLA